MMTAPDKNGTPALPKRNGAKGMLPGTWTGRVLKVEYVSADGLAATTSGVLLDYFPCGPVLNVEGKRTMICWERLTVLELQPD